MKKIKVAEASGGLLDWLVARCEGYGLDLDDPADPWLTLDGIVIRPLSDYSPTDQWRIGGPILEREKIAVEHGGDAFDGWVAQRRPCDPDDDEWVGPTPLVAAMRAYVAYTLGDEVEVPEGLA